MPHVSLNITSQQPSQEFLCIMLRKVPEQVFSLPPWSSSLSASPRVWLVTWSSCPVSSAGPTGLLQMPCSISATNEYSTGGSVKPPPFCLVPASLSSVLPDCCKKGVIITLTTRGNQTQCIFFIRHTDFSPHFFWREKCVLWSKKNMVYERIHAFTLKKQEKGECGELMLKGCSCILFQWCVCTPGRKQQLPAGGVTPHSALSLRGKA